MGTRGMFGLVLAVLVLGAGVACGQQAGPGELLPLPADLAFIRPAEDLPTQGALCLLDRGTGTVSDLSAQFGLGAVGHPSWSPDGMRLVFERGGDIWSLALNEGEARRLTDTGDCSAPAWHPQRDAIWYTRLLPRAGGGQRPETWRVGAQGTERRKVFDWGEGWDMVIRALWHPQGLVCAMTATFEEGEGAATALVLPSGRELSEGESLPGARDLPARDLAQGAVAWCPSDPSQVARATAGMHTPDLLELYRGGRWVTVYEGRWPTEAEPGALVWWPAWSPDGSLVSVTVEPVLVREDTWHYQPRQIHLYRVATGGLELLLENADQAAWRPATP